MLKVEYQEAGMFEINTRFPPPDELKATKIRSDLCMDVGES